MMESVVFLKHATEEIATLESGILTVHQSVNQLVAWAGSAGPLDKIEANYRSEVLRPSIEAKY
jgi:hypothetical protein